MKSFWEGLKERLEKIRDAITNFFKKKEPVKEIHRIKTIQVEVEPGKWEAQEVEEVTTEPIVPNANDIKTPKKKSWFSKQASKVVNNIKTFIEKAIDEPAKFMVVATGAATAFYGMLAAIEKFNTVVRRPMEQRREMYNKSLDYYDNVTQKHLKLNYPLTPEQINQVNIQTSMGVPAAVALQRMGYLAGF